MAPSPRRAAYGFSVHTGWAMAVAVAGPLSSPQLLLRQRIEFKPGAESVHVFHVAAEKTGPEAKRHYDRCKALVAAQARSQLELLLEAINPAPTALGIVVGNAALPSSLEAILRSHMQIHSAEGNFYRGSLLDAGAVLKLKSRAVPARELAPRAMRALKIDEAKLSPFLSSIRCKVGRPWGRDEKDAFLAACIALAA